ncbi:hypothetical protein Tco_1427872 [Tanacetum coccineum]
MYGRLDVRNITPTGSTIPRLQEVEDLQGDDLLYYDAEMELMNMILLSIPNEVYNSMDSCKTAKEIDNAQMQTSYKNVITLPKAHDT